MTKVEKKASLTAPFIPFSENSSHSENHLKSFTGKRRTLTMASRQCGVNPLAQVGHNNTPSPNLAIHHYYAPFFSPLPNSHFSPPGISLLTQFTFSSVSQPFDSQHTHHYTSA